jgi:NitT/TauT family transport system substrate-binding protein
VVALPQVIIAVPMQIISAPMLVANGQGLFRAEGIDVTLQPFQIGKDALKAVMDGHADLALVADTPLMFALAGGADIAMLASIAESRRSLGIVARRDRGIRNIKDLSGKRIGLTMGTNLTYFLDALLQVNGVANDTVVWTDLGIDALYADFAGGRLDAAVMFQPYLKRIENEMGDRVQVFYGEDVYAFRLILAGRPGWIDSHPDAVRSVLKALIAATNSIQAKPEQARKVVGPMIGMDDAILAQLFDPEDFAVSLDQAMLLALDDQTRWAMKEHFIIRQPMPNYLDAMRYNYLKSVLPDAVTLVY